MFEAMGSAGADGGGAAAAAAAASVVNPWLRGLGEDVEASELVDRLAGFERSERMLAAARLRSVAALDTAQRAGDTQMAQIAARLRGRTVGVQVALVSGMSATAGSSRVSFARTLLDEHTALLRLADEGLISEWHLRMVVAATTDLSPDQKRHLAVVLADDIRDRHERGRVRSSV
jgi:hypothetical protein